MSTPYEQSQEPSSQFPVGNQSPSFGGGMIMSPFATFGSGKGQGRQQSFPLPIQAQDGPRPQNTANMTDLFANQGFMSPQFGMFGGGKAPPMRFTGFPQYSPFQPSPPTFPSAPPARPWSSISGFSPQPVYGLGAGFGGLGSLRAMLTSQGLGPRASSGQVPIYVGTGGGFMARPRPGG